MAGDYTAYELRQIAKSGDTIKEAALDWVGAVKALDKAYLQSGTFGSAGDDAGLPENYGNVVTSVIVSLNDGVYSLEDCALALFRIAKVYEENEEALEKEILKARGVRAPKGIAPERRFPGF
ncbi:hypothetical protein [Actinocorallia libanotica]|uniref:Excreted virulence factor EspC (Type VII ESX diderm) n=1 Tax=Actinocorallia libanotica TaxID=46162 RepID=A0ABN1RPM8_9ACTN